MLEKTEENALGYGSYGAVYKARVGHLPCAAKIIHPTLFHGNDPGSDRIRVLFERECNVLRRIRHPHVIQYIKSYQDEETRLPVLLMELMDESLTHYLEHLRSHSTLVPYHVKLNISHDVALALEFLHSIGILHRDLSSNNVLLIAGKRAKVTDFGVAKVWDGHTQMTPATYCPGTMAYMPPEAFKAEPIYTEKLDIFSLGVVYLQILTLQFPNPGDRVRQIFDDERYPMGIEVIIPERNRRQAEIDQVTTPDDPLLLIALECFHDKAFMRPSAGEVCGRIETLKSTSWSEFVSEQERLEMLGAGSLVARGNQTRENGFEEGSLRDVRTELQEAQGQVTTAQSRINKLQTEVEEKEREIDELRKKLVKSEKEHQETVNNIMESVREKQEMLMMQGDRYQPAYDEEVAEKDQRIAELEKMVKRYQEDIERRNRQDQQQSLPIPLVSRTTSATDISSIARSLPARSPPSPHRPTPHSSPLPSPQLPPGMRWRAHDTARCIEGNSTARFNSSVFFTDGTVVLQFNDTTNEWTTLPPCPKHSFAIAVVGGLPTAVGGFSVREGNSASLLSLSTMNHHRSWQNTYPAMRHARTSPATATTGNLLVVVGGHGLDDTGRSVELLNTSTMVWSQATSLPFSIWRASAVTCGDRLYIAGGEKEGKPLGCANVLYCSLSSLQTTPTNSAQSLPTSKKFRPFRLGNSMPKVWHEASKLPVVQSTLVSCQGQVFAVGGQNSITNQPVSDVYRYSPSSNDWTVCGHMTLPRSRCFAVGLHGNQLMVLGGYIEPYTLTDSVEIAQLPVANS